MANMRYQLSVVGLLLALWEGFATNSHHSRRPTTTTSLSKATLSRKPWGLPQTRLIIPSTSNNNNKETLLKSFLLQVRGGGKDESNNNYYAGDYRDDYYSRNSSGDPRRPNQQGGGSGYYDEYYDRPYDQGAKGKTEYDDYGRYDYDDGRGSPPPSSPIRSTSLSSLQSKLKNGDRRIGVPLLGLGVVFTVMGVSLFFNKALMRLGNLMFIMGIPTTIGPKRTAGYFFQPQKTRATACLFAGIFLVFVGWPITGIALEIFGVLNLFGNMFPMFWAVFKNMPFVSSIVNSTGANGGSSSGGKSRQSPSYYKDRDYPSSRDPYYEDRQGYDDYRDDDAEPFY